MSKKRWVLDACIVWTKGTIWNLQLVSRKFHWINTFKLMKQLSFWSALGYYVHRHFGLVLWSQNLKLWLLSKACSKGYVLCRFVRLSTLCSNLLFPVFRKQHKVHLHTQANLYSNYHAIYKNRIHHTVPYRLKTNHHLMHGNYIDIDCKSILNTMWKLWRRNYCRWIKQSVWPVCAWKHTAYYSYKQEIHMYVRVFDNLGLHAWSNL